MDTNVSISRNINETKDLPLHLSFQTADIICFSRNSANDSSAIRLNDLITLNRSAINESIRYEDTLLEGTQLDVFVHYPNQLLQSFGKTKYSTSFSHLLSTLNDTNPRVLQIKISECKRLRKRINSNEPCSKKIQNYDQYLQEKVVEHLECVPVYFKQVMSNHSKIKDCDSKSKLMEAQYIIDNFDKFLNHYEKPCDDMLVLTIDSVDNSPNPKPTDIAIKFVYSTQLYEEILYTRAIGFESWLSNVGGFVGIFLGYSMMQFPDILLFFATVFNYERKVQFKGKMGS